MGAPALPSVAADTATAFPGDTIVSLVMLPITADDAALAALGDTLTLPFSTDPILAPEDADAISDDTSTFAKTGISSHSAPPKLYGAVESTLVAEVESATTYQTLAERSVLPVPVATSTSSVIPASGVHPLPPSPRREAAAIRRFPTVVGVRSASALSDVNVESVAVETGTPVDFAPVRLMAKAYHLLAVVLKVTATVPAPSAGDAR